jgi:L-aminopeptidase/D-esterase-like protein
MQKNMLFLMLVLVSMYTTKAQPTRARNLGIPFDGTPGPFNAITDVPGVLVGYKTLISGTGESIRGKGPVRTGVTAILPRGINNNPVYANWYTLNGNGEMTGTTWITESGFLEGPILITNTNSVGVVRDAVLPHQLKRIAARVPIGIGIVGGRGENSSGDIFLAFSKADP